MNQPTFWLQVRSEYIIENFDNLITYLRAYNYQGSEADNADYITTINCMSDLCKQYSEIIFQTPFYCRPEIEISTPLAVRIFAATILAAHKAGRTPHLEILALIDLLMKTGVAYKNSVHDGISLVIVCCLRGQQLRMPIFTWEIIERLTSNFDLLFIQLSQMKFAEAAPDTWFIVENQGLLAVGPTDAPSLMAMNRADFESTPTQQLFNVQGIVDVLVNKKSFKRYADYAKLDDYMHGIFNAMNAVKTSPASQRSRYAPGDYMLVRIVEITGYKIVAETIDPAFEKIRGNLRLQTYYSRPDVNVVRKSIDVGDYLEATYVNEGTTQFSTEKNIEEFYRSCAADLANKKFWAVYLRDYSAGKEFISIDGIRFGVDHSKFKILSDEEAEIVDTRIEDGEPIMLQAYRQAQIASGKNFSVYAEFVTDNLDEVIPEDEIFDREDAEYNFMEIFLRECRTDAEELLNETPHRVFKNLDSTLCTPLLTLLYRNIESISGSSIDRLCLYSAMTMMSRILDRHHDANYVAYCRQLLDTEVRFARNEQMTLQPLPDELSGVEELVRRHRIVDILSSYHHPCSDNEEQRRVAENTEKRIIALVEASNNLIGILDNAELNTIKHFISRALNVEDQYESILDQRTFYGTESISLEFKSSAVFPPSNMRRHASAEVDPEMQKWNILKAVCGFLNSRSGGELLIGVRDTGYACGIKDDIDALYRLGRIDFASPDRYRTYIQLMIDHAFKVRGKSIDSKDITMVNIDYQIEDDDDNKTILRIKVKPYPYGLVELADTDRPEGVEKSYLRLSGRTVPVSKNIAAQIMIYKK